MKNLLLSTLITLLFINVQAETKKTSKNNPSSKNDIISFMSNIVGEHSNNNETECNDVEIVELDDDRGYRVRDGRWTNKLRTNILFKNAKITKSGDLKVITGTSIDPACPFGCVPFTQTEKTKLTINQEGQLVALEVSEKTIGETRSTSCKF